MRRGVDPRQLFGYIKGILSSGQYDRLLANRFFQGTVTSFYLSGSAYFCQVQRTGDGGPDGNTYLCVTPGYQPLIGDVVECFWRDLAVGYVWAPISRRNNAAFGYLKYFELDSNQGSITTNVAVTGSALVLTPVDLTRVYRLSAQGSLQSTVAGDVMSLRIQLGANSLQTISVVEPTISEPVNAAGSVIVRPGDLGYPADTGSSYTLTVERTTGTGTVTLNAAAQGPSGRPCYFLIEDIGSTN